MDQLPFQLPADWQGALTLLSTVTFGAWFISEFVETEDWFLTLTSAWKSRVVFLILLLLSIIGKGGLIWTNHQAVTLQDVYVAFGVAFVGYLSSSWYHKRNHNVTDYTSKERAATAAKKSTIIPLSADKAPEQAAA